MSALRIGSLCSGYGGLDMAVRAVLGGELAWVADSDPGAAAILAHHHPQAPNLGDITAVEWRRVALVEVLTAGFPCQDISNAGPRAGIGGKRSGIWANVAHAIGLLRPHLVFLENVAAITVRGLPRVLADLATLGFDAEWTVLRASDIGAPHRRERWFCLAWPADPDRARRQGPFSPAWWRPSIAQRGADADPARDGWHQGWPQSARQFRGHDPARSGAFDWGIYAPAITRWEHLTGRYAPSPVKPAGRHHLPRLSPTFVEWLMGLPVGHVTEVSGLSRTAQLAVLGNGVVPQQGAAALATLLTHRDQERNAA